MKDENNAPCKINTYFIGGNPLLNTKWIKKTNSNFFILKFNNSLERNKKDLYFPHDCNRQDSNKEKEKKSFNHKSTFVNLENEYDEDRELLELLLNTKKSKLII